MAIKVRCQCGKTFSAKDEYAGRTFKCPNCGQTLKVPGHARRAYDVFISHSKDDKTTADAICATLEANKIRCWIAPRDILPGKEWGEAIIDGINECRVMVVVFSRYSNGSRQVYREIERAINKNLIVIPFRIEDIPMAKQLEYFLSAAHWLDAITPPLQAHIEDLKDSVALLLSKDGSKQVPPKPQAATTTTRVQPKNSKLGWPGIAAGIGALLTVLVVAVVWFNWSKQPNPEPGDESTGPLQPATVAQDIIEAQSAALVAWDRVKKLDRENGFAQQLDAIDARVRSAETLFARGPTSELLANYTRILEDCQAVEQADRQRQLAVAEQELASETRGTAERLGASTSGSTFWRQGISKDEQAQQHFVQGDFAEAADAWKAANLMFQQAAQAVQGIEQLNAARTAFEDELAGYDLDELQREGIGWNDVLAAVSSAEQALNDGRFSEAIEKYNQARRSLSAVAPIQRKLAAKMDIDLYGLPLVEICDYMDDLADGLEVVVNKTPLEHAGIDYSQPLSLDATGLSFETTLTQLLAAMGEEVNFEIRKGQFLFVSTSSELEALRADDPTRMLWRSASANDKLRASLNKRADFFAIDFALRDAIDFYGDLSSIEFVVNWSGLGQVGITPDSVIDLDNYEVKNITADQCLWLISAITGNKISFTALDQEQVIFVSTHEDVNTLQQRDPLERLRQRSQQDASVRGRLEQRIDLELFDTSLEDAFEFVRFLPESKLDLLLNWPVLERGGVDRLEPLNLSVSRVTVEHALWLVWAISKRGFSYDVTDEGAIVVIAERDDEAGLEKN